jgi:hypothetical protein
MKRAALWFALLALAGAVLVTRVVGAPAFTDAYYHYNGAARMASGFGLTETYLWTYTGAPDSIRPDGTLPSHLYWMPMTSLLGALGMALSGTDSFQAAQLPLTACLWGAALLAYAIARRLDPASVRTAWYAGIIVLGGGFYARFWGTTDTFAPYALFGGGCLALMGAGLSKLRTGHAGRGLYACWAAAGVLAALGHLTRPDGLLLLLTGLALLMGMAVRLATRRAALQSAILFAGVYVVAMLPWLARNLAEIGSPLPLGGTASVWFIRYDDLFLWPDSATFGRFWDAGGLSLLASTRWEAFAGPSGLLSGNLGTFIAVEGMIVMTPFMLLGLWRRRRDAFLWPFLLFALGIHAAMTLVFPFPGARGGLLHAATALMPFWAVLALLGISDAAAWMAKRRRTWHAGRATAVFSVALTGYAVLLSALIASRGGVPVDGPAPAFYAEMAALLPDDARVMINDPSALYHYTGLGGAPVPAAAQDVIPALAQAYALDYVVLERAGLPAAMADAFDAPAAFLERLPFSDESVRVYAISPSVP